MIISLTGFMGVGKSTLARLLAGSLCCRVIDLDRLVETEQGRSVAEIFQNYGENYFRALEEEALKRIISDNSERLLILSLGGGTLISENNQKIIKEHTHCIYLRASVNLLTERLASHRGKRPALDSIDDNSLELEVSNLLQKRLKGYENTAKLIIDVDEKSVRSILNEIISGLDSFSEV
ncbi:MAG TPA: dephospho-CoA kinase [Bacteroidales bacterium]|nr:dephospho-CoA kinase [Bacteroidales bacterium]